MRTFSDISAAFVLVLGACAAACSSDSGPDDAAGGSTGTGGSAGSNAGISGSPANGGSAGAGIPNGGMSGGGAAGSGASGEAAGESNGGTPSGGTAGSAGSTAGSGGSAGSSGSSGAAGTGGNGGSGGSGGGSGTTPTTVWIAGDSTVQTCSGACPCGWGGEFDALFNDKVTVVNRAVGGRSIQTWLREPAVSDQKTAAGECTLTSQAQNARWTGMLDASTGMKAGDTLIIQFGINDGDSSCPRHVGTALYDSYLAEMAKAAKDRGAQPIFVTPTSAIKCSGSTAVATRGFLTIIKDAGKKNGVPVVDLHQLSIDLYNQLGLCPNDANYSTGKVGEFFCDDHTHFDKPGAKQIAQVMAKALKTQGLPLASYLK